MDLWEKPLPPIDLSERAILRISGADAARYLNGQISSDLRKLTSDEAMPACILDARGRLQALVQMRAEMPDRFLLDAPGALREALVARLERYIVADDVMVEDLSGAFRLLFIEGDEPVLGEEAFAGAPGPVRSRRFGKSGRDYWLPAASPQPADLVEILAEGSALVQAVRIARGHPAWDAELTPATLPGEAGLDAWAVDFSKGCYVGQEVVSRMKSVGHPARLLRRLRHVAGPEPRPGWVLTEVGGQPVGSITSVAPDGILTIRAALGYVKWACTEEEFLAGPDQGGAYDTRMALWG